MKKTKKILISVLTAGCLASAAFGLAACGGGDETGETPATPSDEYVVYTVTFDTNGGTLLPEQGAEAGDKAVKPGDPKKAGYIFGGWYANAACTQAYDFNSTITGDTTIYAKWDAAPTTDAEYFRLTQDGEGWSVAAMPGKIMPTDVVIPATIDNKTITSVAVSGFEDVGNVQSVTLPDTVTTIGQRAFRNCTDLEVVLGGANVEMIDSDAFDNTVWDNNLPAGEVYLGKTLYKYASSIFVETEIEVKEGTVGIASGAFLNQPNLVGVTLPEGLKYIGSYAFGADTAENGNGVTEVVLPDSVVEVGAGAFRYAPIETLIIGKGVEYIGAKAFAGTDITYLEFNAANGVIADATFDGLTSPATVKIADEVKTFPENLVKGWDGIVSLDLGAGVTVIPAGALDGHTALSEVNFGSIVRIGGNAFRGTGLKNVTLPVTLNRLGNSAFENCKDLEALTVNAESVGISGKTFPAFKGCEKLAAVDFGSTVREIPDYLFYGSARLTSLNFAQGVEKIGMYAFYGTSLSGKLVLPEGLKSIGDHAFDAGTDDANTEFGSTPVANLQNLVVPSTLEEIGSMAFANNLSLTYLAWNAANVKTTVYNVPGLRDKDSFVSAFSGCKELKYVNLGSTVNAIPAQFLQGAKKVEEVDLRSIKTVGANAFEGCVSLVSLGSRNGASIETLGADAFTGTAWFTNLLSSNDGKPYYIGKVLAGFSGEMSEEYALSVVGQNAVSIADNAFKNQTNLKTISISTGRTVLTAIGESAFEGCTGLTTFSTGGSSSVLQTIGNRAFYGCTGLETLSLTNVVTIGEYAFGNCTKLYTSGDFEIPATVETIGQHAFDGMKLVGALKTASGSVLKEIGDSAFLAATPNAITLSESCERVGTKWVSDGTNKTIQTFSAPGLKYAGSLPLGGSPVDATFDFSKFEYIGTLGTQWTRQSYVFDSLTSMGNLFGGHGASDKLTNVSGNKNVQEVTFMQPIEEIPEQAFAGTTKLQTVTFEYPEALKKIGTYGFQASHVENIDLSSVVNFGNYCFQGSYVKIKDFTVNPDVEVLGEYAFQLCEDITGTLTVRTNTLEEIATRVFQNTAYDKLIVGGAVKTIGNRSFGMWPDDKRGTDRSPNPIVSGLILEEGVVTSGAQSFVGKVGNVAVLPSTLTTAGGYDQNLWGPATGFRDFKVIKLTGFCEPTDFAMEYPPFSDSAVILCANAEDAAKVKASAVWEPYRDRVIIPSNVVEDVWYVTDEGELLTYTGNKTEISIPAAVKSMPDITALLGTNDADLTAEITFTAAADSGFKYENGMLTSKDGTVIYFYTGSADETRVTNATVTEVKPYAFYKNTTITEVTLSAVKTIGAYAFNNCTNLATFSFDNVETIGNNAFEKCGFSDVVLEAIVTIGDSAFATNSALTNVTIGEKCTAIGGSAFTTSMLGFANTTGVIIVKATVPPTGSGMFARLATQMRATIKVPAASVEAYKAADGWSAYASHIEANS